MTKPSDLGSNPYIDQLNIANKQKAEKPRNELGQNEFFELMVAQLKHQDPMKPMESNEFLGQMAQFTSVNGIQEMSKSFADLASSLQSSQALQASTLVGRDVMVPGTASALAAGGALRGGVELPESTDALTVRITDPAGQVVRTLNLGPAPAGMTSFAWDGLTEAGDAAPPGAYALQASYDKDGQAMGAQTFVAAHVESVSLGRGGQAPVLNVAGLGPMPLADVREIL